MKRYRTISIALLTLVSMTASAQKAERDHIRRGNRQFKDSVFVEADVNYRKALEANPQSTIAMFNLGNVLMQQNKLPEAMEQYAAASRIDKDKGRLAQMFHNMGVILHSQKEYAKAVEAYKQSLRNNPKDDETRYNLALAQKMLKDHQQNQQNQDQQQQQQQQQQEQQQQEQKQQNQDQQPQQQPPKNDNQMSKENAEQLLKSMMRDEKDVQDKVKKQQQVIQGGKLEKDW